MKKILVTGVNSYIGLSLKKYLESKADEYSVDSISVRGDEWKKADFSKYDAVFHAAGLAHIKETKQNSHLYYEINRNMAAAVAEKAKADGVNQFIFMSSMSVYGLDTGVINENTMPCPNSSYGKSKLEAEKLISELADDSFKVCILRPPMVYGPGCKGNFGTVIKLVKKFPFFPKIANKRSMIYIDNLCEFVRLAIDRELSGLYFPQNKEYMNTSDMALWIGKAMGKKLRMSRFLGFCVKVIQPFSKLVRKAFGSLTYEGTERLDWEYCIADNENSVRNSLNV